VQGNGRQIRKLVQSQSDQISRQGRDGGSGEDVGRRGQSPSNSSVVLSCDHARMLDTTSSGRGLDARNIDTTSSGRGLDARI